jgi:hypothetical protein
MSSNDRLDPHSFSGCFAELESDLPGGVTLAGWRSERHRPVGDAAPAASRAPQVRTLRARWWARRPRSGRGPGPRRTR